MFLNLDTIFVPVIAVIVCAIRIITTLTRPVSEWILNVLYWIVIGRTKALPPVKNPILLKSATEIAESIRTLELTAQEVTAAYIQRCKEVNPLINAINDERFEEAMEEAAEIDRLLKFRSVADENLAMAYPLLGVPFSCKEAIGVKGLLQTSGIYQAKDRKAFSSADSVFLYRKAGAIPIVVTNVPECCMWWECANIPFGWTKNPYDNRRTVGGSSGGEGAIITSCGAPIGIGSDLAGSIRLPASFCGIYGHKPSKGLISNEGGWPEMIPKLSDELKQFLTTGPMCRYVEDLPLLTQILAGDNAIKVPFGEEVDFRRVKIFYMEEFPGCLLSATNDIKAAVRKAVRHFEVQFGITATKLHIPELKYAFYMWECKLLEADGPSFKEALGNINITWEFLKSLVRSSKHTWPALYFAAVDRRKKDAFYDKCLKIYNDLKNTLEDCLEGNAILLAPTHPDPPPHYLMTIPKYPNIAYTCIFNILGYPSTQIPTGMSGGLPIGIQAISTQYKDHLTLAAATELDRVFQGWISPCPIES